MRTHLTAVGVWGGPTPEVRDLRTSGPSVHFPVSSHKFPPSTSATRALGTKSNHSVLFPPYPREMKTNTAKFKSAAILSLAFLYGNGATHSHARGLSMLWRAG